MPTRASMPWFQLDARDYLSDEKIDAMPQEAVGLLVRVWCLCWIEGSAPADQDELCRKTRCRLDYVATHIVDILPFFEVRDRRLYSLRMERQKHLSAVRAASGKKGFAASKFLPVQTGGLPRQLFAERSSALPGQTDGLPEQKGDLPGKLPNPLPSNPLGSKNKNDANSEKAPDGLNGFQYAAALLEKLGTVQTRTLLPIVVEAIGLLAKDEGITEADATDLDRKSTRLN